MGLPGDERKPVLSQQFLPERGAKNERRSPALLQAESAGTRKLGRGPQLF